MALFYICFYTLNFHHAHQCSSLAIFITTEKTLQTLSRKELASGKQEENIQFNLLAKVCAFAVLPRRKREGDGKAM